MNIEPGQIWDIQGFRHRIVSGGYDRHRRILWVIHCDLFGEPLSGTTAQSVVHPDEPGGLPADLWTQVTS